VLLVVVGFAGGVSDGVVVEVGVGVAEVVVAVAESPNFAVAAAAAVAASSASMRVTKSSYLKSFPIVNVFR
jgi:hypothetical protein